MLEQICWSVAAFHSAACGGGGGLLNKMWQVNTRYHAHASSQQNAVWDKALCPRQWQPPQQVSEKLNKAFNWTQRRQGGELSNYLCAVIMRQKALGWHFEYAYYDCNYMAAGYLTPAFKIHSISLLDDSSLPDWTQSWTDISDHWAKKNCFSLWCYRFAWGNNDQPSTSLSSHALEGITDMKRLSEIKTVQQSHSKLY